jgi:hypothetical protein
MILSIDLASKFSAVCVYNGRQVVEEFDSAGMSAFDFVLRVVRAVQYNPRLIVVEDVPYGISNQSMVKPVLRLQGVLIHGLGLIKALDRTVFVNPRVWQSTFEGVARGDAKDRIEAARVAALSLGYSAPDLVAMYMLTLEPGERVLKKHTAPLEKQMTDYVDAFLIAAWATQFETVEQILAHAKGVQGVYI